VLFVKKKKIFLDLFFFFFKKKKKEEKKNLYIFNILSAIKETTPYYHILSLFISFFNLI